MTVPKPKEVYFLVDEDALVAYGARDGMTREDMEKTLDGLCAEDGADLVVIRGMRVELKLVLDDK